MFTGPIFYAPIYSPSPPNASITYSVSTNFSIGDIAYVVYKANKGILEKVAIKSIRVREKYSTSICYKDTVNQNWREDELCSLDDAITLASDYLNNRIAQIDSFLAG